jgi:hypothetical protein
MKKKERNFKRVFNVDGLSTCCGQEVNPVLAILDRKKEAVKPSALDMNIVMRFKSGELKRFDTVCSRCGRQTHALDVKGGKYPTTLIDFKSLKMFKEYDHKIRLTAGRTHYRWLNTCDKDGNVRGVTLRQDRIWNVFNPKTGFLFSCVRDGGDKKIVVRNHTYSGAIVGPFNDKLKWKFLLKSLDARAYYTWPIDVAQELRQHPQAPLNPEVDNRGYVFTCLRFPALATLPIANWGPPPRKWRKFLTTEMRRKAVINKIFNSPTKKVAGLVWSDDVQLSDLQLTCQVFKKEYVERLADVGAFSKNHGVGGDFGWRETILKDSPVIKQLKRFIKEYGEKRLINQMVKSHGEPSPTGAVARAEADGVPLALHSSNDLHYLGDSTRMWTDIIECMPDYQMPRDRTLKDVHDKISKDHRRIQTSDKAISYSDDEWKLNEVWDEGVVFTLPLRTHDLTYAASQLGSSCVGSYAKGAAEKLYTIVFVNAADDGRVIAALQIGDDNSLIQAKGFNNYTLPFETGGYVIDWCEKHNINYKKCFELNAAMRNIKTGLDAVQPEYVGTDIIPIRQAAEHQLIDARMVADNGPALAQVVNN